MKIKHMCTQDNNICFIKAYTNKKIHTKHIRLFAYDGEGYNGSH